MGNLKWQDFRHSSMVLSFARSSFVYHRHLSAWRHGTQMCHFVWHKLLVFKKKFRPRKKCLRKTMPDQKNRLTQVTCHQKEILLFACLWKWGEVELLRVEAIKAKWFNSPPNFYLNAPTQFLQQTFQIKISRSPISDRSLIKICGVISQAGRINRGSPLWQTVGLFCPQWETGEAAKTWFCPSIHSVLREQPQL